MSQSLANCPERLEYCCAKHLEEAKVSSPEPGPLFSPPQIPGAVRRQERAGGEGGMTLRIVFETRREKRNPYRMAQAGRSGPPFPPSPARCSWLENRLLVPRLNTRGGRKGLMGVGGRKSACRVPSLLALRTPVPSGVVLQGSPVA